MRTVSLLLVCCFPILILSCTSTTANPPKVELTPQQVIQKNIDSLIRTAQPGDLIARMNENIISYHVKNFNYSDKSFSHAGVVMMKDGRKVVCNIDANEKGMDTVRYDVIEKFIDPNENYLCGLFRFDLNETEKENFFKELNAYHDKHAHFDRRFDLATDSLVYCSEMISKSLTRATKGRLVFKEVVTPKHMLPLMTKFFKEEAPKNTPDKKVAEVIERRKYVSIDALYLIPDCKELMRFKLKHFQGDDSE
jgi:hypothetical protein